MDYTSLVHDFLWVHIVYQWITHRWCMFFYGLICLSIVFIGPIAIIALQLVWIKPFLAFGVVATSQYIWCGWAQSQTFLGCVETVRLLSDNASDLAMVP